MKNIKRTSTKWGVEADNLNENFEDINKISERLVPFSELAWEIGTINVSTTPGKNQNAANRIRTPDFFPVKEGTKIIGSANSSEYAVVFYDFDKNYISYIGYDTASREIEQNCLVKIILKKADNSNLSYPLDQYLEDLFIEYSDEQKIPISNIVQRNRHRADGLLSIGNFNQSVVRSITDIPQKTQFSMAVTTDLHGSAIGIKNFITYINEYQRYFDCGINLGDVALNSPSDGFEFFTNEAVKSEIPMLTILGNHDRKQNDDEISLTDAFDMAIKPLADEGFFITSLPYYYKDFVTDSYKVRMICLNPYGAPSDETLPTADYSVRATFWDEAQLNWLADLLYGTADDYHVIVAMHNPDNGTHVVIDSSFSTYPFKTAGIMENAWYKLQDDNAVYDLVNAFKHSVNFSKTYNAINDNDALPDITITKDFSDRANDGNFVCYITGHWHRQIICTVPGYTDQLLIVFDVGSAYQHQRMSSDMRSEAGTIAEDNFTCFGLDTENKLIKLFKVGNTRTIHGEIRDFEAVSYNVGD